MKQLDQIQGILQCYGGPLSCARAHGMRGIADKDHAILVPRREAWDLINVRFDGFDRISWRSQRN